MGSPAAQWKSLNVATVLQSANKHLDANSSLTEDPNVPGSMWVPSSGGNNALLNFNAQGHSLDQNLVGVEFWSFYKRPVAYWQLKMQHVWRK